MLTLTVGIGALAITQECAALSYGRYTPYECAVRSDGWVHGRITKFIVRETERTNIGSGYRHHIEMHIDVAKATMKNPPETIEFRRDVSDLPRYGEHGWVYFAVTKKRSGYEPFGFHSGGWYPLGHSARFTLYRVPSRELLVDTEAAKERGLLNSHDIRDRWMRFVNDIRLENATKVGEAVYAMEFVESWTDTKWHTPPLLAKLEKQLEYLKLYEKNRSPESYFVGDIFRGLFSFTADICIRQDDEEAVGHIWAMCQGEKDIFDDLPGGSRLSEILEAVEQYMLNSQIEFVEQ